MARTEETADDAVLGVDEPCGEGMCRCSCGQGCVCGCECPGGPDRRAEATALDPDDDSACSCGGAWHAVSDHCVSWPCPGCDYLCPRIGSATPETLQASS